MMHGRKSRESPRGRSCRCIEVTRRRYGDWIQAARIVLQGIGRMAALGESDLMLPQIR